MRSIPDLKMHFSEGLKVHFLNQFICPAGHDSRTVGASYEILPYHMILSVVCRLLLKVKSLKVV